VGQKVRTWPLTTSDFAMMVCKCASVLYTDFHNCFGRQIYLLVLVVTTFVFIFPFLMAAVRAVSLVRPVPLFFFSLLYCMVCYGTNKGR